MSVLDRVTDTEKQELQALRAAWEQAKAKRAADEEAKETLQKAIWAGERRQGPNVRAAFAAFQAGKPPPAQSDGLSQAELLRAKKGADAVLREDRDDEERALGALRSRSAAIVKACAERLAPELVAAAAQLRAVWTAIAGANAHLESVGGQDAAIADHLEWRKLYLPATKQLVALERASTDMGDGFHTRVLYSAADRYDQTAASAQTELERALTAAIGTWPFGAAPSIDTSGVAYQMAEMARGEADEVARKSRRAAIAEAAERILP